MLEHLRAISHRCSARELAAKVLEVYFNGEKPKFPINIFKMLNDFGVKYKFMKLEKLEGMYSPGSEEYVSVVAINSNRPYTRQRFTAAHELCHHIKHYDMRSVSPTESRDPREIEANVFASELLMPYKYFRESYEPLLDKNGYVSIDDAFLLAQMFGTSFESVIYQLSYHGKLGFKPNKDFFNNINMQEYLERLKLQNIDDQHLRQIIDNYAYVPQTDTSPLWLRFKNSLIYNDNRIEGLNIDKSLVSEICTDLRLKGEKSIYYTEHKNNPAIIETVGHSLVYDFIMKTNDRPDSINIKELHKILFSLAPYNEMAGTYRQTDNDIKGARILTTHYKLIPQEMYFLDRQIDQLYMEIDHLSYSQCLEKAVEIHHTLTKIHPFEDGNGRISRAILNWILNTKKLPPIFVDDKSTYLDALYEADNWNFTKLNKYFLERLLYSLIELNDQMSLSHAPDHDI